MRDMLDTDSGQPYPLAAWAAPLQRIRRDLDDALAREAEVGAGSRTPEQRQYLVDSLAQFWDAADRIFALARDGHEDEARSEIRLSLQARQAALGTAVARLLVNNNESEEETAARVQGIYNQVERQVYGFLAATLAAIAITSLYLIRSNRRLFARLDALSRERRDVAQQLITARESTLRHIARELHDEFGQTLTAMGSMLGRAERQAPPGSPLRTEMRDVAEIAQRMLEQVRGLAQALHPSILEAVGLEGTIEWYLSTVERQTGITVAYERSGPPAPVDVTVGTHVYRILQEALNNVAKHSASTQAWVRLSGHRQRARARRRGSRRGHAGGREGARTRTGHDAGAGRADRRHARVPAAARGRHAGAAAGPPREPPDGDAPCRIKITVLLADDHSLVRRGFRRMLDDDPAIVVVGEACERRGGGRAGRRALAAGDRHGLRDAADDRPRRDAPHPRRVAAGRDPDAQHALGADAGAAGDGGRGARLHPQERRRSRSRRGGQAGRRRRDGARSRARSIARPRRRGARPTA